MQVTCKVMKPEMKSPNIYKKKEPTAIKHEDSLIYIHTHFKVLLHVTHLICIQQWTYREKENININLKPR